MFQKFSGQKPGDNTPLPSLPPTPGPGPAPTDAAPNFTSAVAQPAPVAAPRPAAAPTRNVLSTDVEVKGTLKFTNDLIVDGRIEGEITSDGNLTVGENARIKSEIRTSCVIVHGKVHGNITATNRVDLKAGAEVVGDIKTKILSMEPGAILIGKATVGTPTTAPASAPAAKPAEAPKA
jgi:cytoskeletal protein CcmA (bactofilin family)